MYIKRSPSPWKFCNGISVTILEGKTPRSSNMVKALFASTVGGSFPILITNIRRFDGRLFRRADFYLGRNRSKTERKETSHIWESFRLYISQICCYDDIKKEIKKFRAFQIQKKPSIQSPIEKFHWRRSRLKPVLST